MLVFSGQAVFYVARERQHLWSSRPGKWLIVSSAVDLTLISFLAINGILMKPLAIAVVAGLLLGILQAFTDGILTPLFETFLRTYTKIYSAGALQQVVPYMILVFVLLVRPQGIFGRRGTERL